jgi:hypothetical protein
MIALALLLMQYRIIKRLYIDIVSFPIFWLKTHRPCPGYALLGLHLRPIGPWAPAGLVRSDGGSR